MILVLVALTSMPNNTSRFMKQRRRLLLILLLTPIGSLCILSSSLVILLNLKRVPTSGIVRYQPQRMSSFPALLKQSGVVAEYSLSWLSFPNDRSSTLVFPMVQHLAPSLFAFPRLKRL